MVRRRYYYYWGIYNLRKYCTMISVSYYNLILSKLFNSFNVLTQCYVFQLCTSFKCTCTDLCYTRCNTYSIDLLISTKTLRRNLRDAVFYILITCILWNCDLLFILVQQSYKLYCFTAFSTNNLIFRIIYGKFFDFLSLTGSLMVKAPVTLPV